MSSVKLEYKPLKRNSGGRPKSEGWTLYNFERAEDTNGKILAKCSKCLSTLKNTSFSRMANHRKKCGLVTTSEGQHFVIKDAQEQKSDLTTVEYEEEQEISLWPCEVPESYIEEPTKVEKVNQTAMEIINEDIQRHRKSSGSKPKLQTDQPSIDVALSSFLIGCNLTFDVADSEHFRKFVNALNPNYDLPTSNQLKTRVLSHLSSMNSAERKSKKRRLYESSESESN